MALIALHKGMLALTLFAVSAHAAPIAKEEVPDFGYMGEVGPEGEEWAALSDNYTQCAEGMYQSPVDISGGETANADLGLLAIEYSNSVLEFAQNIGVQTKFNVTGNATLRTPSSKLYQLEQLHFHRPSEHTIEGKRLPLEAHFVHKQIDGDLTAVLTVLYEESSSIGPTIGGNNTALAAVTDSVPITPGEGQMLNQTVSPIDLLPPGGAYWRYVGSTTTPPCSEGVVWFILKNANVATPDQLSTFTEAAGGVNNNRPRQPLNGRLILT